MKMALVLFNCNFNSLPLPLCRKNTTFNNSKKFSLNTKPHPNHFSSPNKKWQPRLYYLQVVNGSQEDSGKGTHQDDEVNSLGVRAALSMLNFYKREISPILPKSCRFVPTCSEYSMIAYKKYGVVKGTILTAWRLCRCHPLGGTGFDPPRWFDEPSPPEQ